MRKDSESFLNFLAVLRPWGDCCKGNSPPWSIPRGEGYTPPFVFQSYHVKLLVRYIDRVDPEGHPRVYVYFFKYFLFICYHFSHPLLSLQKTGDQCINMSPVFDVEDVVSDHVFHTTTYVRRVGIFPTRHTYAVPRIMGTAIHENNLVC